MTTNNNEGRVHEVNSSQITITNLNAFCKYEGAEVGIAYSYFAGEAWTEGDEVFSKVTGRSFGWLDNQATKYCSDKSSFTRPTKSEVLDALVQYPKLLHAAIDLGWVETNGYKRVPIPITIYRIEGVVQEAAVFSYQDGMLYAEEYGMEIHSADKFLDNRTIVDIRPGDFPEFPRTIIK